MSSSSGHHSHAHEMPATSASTVHVHGNTSGGAGNNDEENGEGIALDVFEHLWKKNAEVCVYVRECLFCEYVHSDGCDY